MQRQHYAATDLAALGREWIAAWNSHDLERILALYAEDAEMTSDKIQALGFEPSGQSSIWCESPKSMVPTMEYWLASEPGAKPDHPGWRGLLSKVLRQRHRPSI